MFAPLLGHGPRQITIAVRSVRRSRNLGLNDQQRQSDCDNGVAESLETFESTLCAVSLRVRR